MAVLTNKSIASTYKSVLSIGATTESALTTSIQQLTDGLGNSSPLSMSTTQIQFNNDANTFSFPTTRGTSGQILKLADANGTLGWVADASGDVTKTGTIALNTIAVWNDNADQLRSDTTMSINASHNISLLQTNSNDDNLNSYNIGGGNIANVTGSRNVGFGKQNLNAVLAGSDNTAMGNGSLEKVTSGNSNTGFGSDALGTSTDGDFNTAVGKGALGDVLTGENNTAVGYNAGANVSTGSDNTYIGKSAGLLDVGSNNIYIGEGSGSSVAAGNNNVILGSNTGNTISATSNNIIISDGSGNNRIQVDSGGNVGIGTTPSDWKSTWKALNIGQSVGLFSQDNNTTGLSSNLIFDGTSWKNKNIGATAFYQQSEGAHYFYGNGSSTDAAGTIFSPTTRLTISSGGDVNIGTADGLPLMHGSVAANASYCTYSFVNDANTGMIRTGADTLALVTAGSAKLTISSAGDVEINNLIKFVDPTAGTAGTPQFKTLISYQHSTINSLSTIKGGNEAGGTNGTYLKFSVNSSAAANIPIDILTLKSAFVGGTTAQFDALIKANNGISFPNQSSGSGTVASSTLDAYEEGTWTPVVRFGTSAATTMTSYVAAYTRIGNVVYIQVSINNIGNTGSGDLFIEGLPYAVGASASFGDVQGTARWAGISTGSGNQMSPYFYAGQSKIAPQIMGGAGYAGAVSNSMASNGWHLYGCEGFYMI